MMRILKRTTGKRRSKNRGLAGLLCPAKPCRFCPVLCHSLLHEPLLLLHRRNRRNRFAGFKNFESLLSSESFLLAAKNTLIFNGVAVPLIILVSLGFALLLNTGIKGLSFYRSSFILPLVVPVASVILVWQILFHERGALSQLLKHFGLPAVNWINSGWSVGVLVLLYIWKTAVITWYCSWQASTAYPGIL